MPRFAPGRFHALKNYGASFGRSFCFRRLLAYARCGGYPLSISPHNVSYGASCADLSIALVTSFIQSSSHLLTT